MPIKRYRKKRAGKRRVFKRRYTRRRRGTYRTSKQNALGFSRSQIVKLRYVQQVALNPAAAAGSTAWCFFGANNINQPNQGASASVSFTTSHQPLAHDNWANIYNHYTVLGSKIKVQFIPNNSSSPFVGGGLVSLLLTDTPTATIVGTTVMESGRAAYKYMSPNGTGPYMLRKNCSVKKFFNVKNLKDNQDNYGALFGSNPNEQAYYNLQFFPADSSVSGVLGPLCLITIDYICLFTGPKDLSQS